MNPKTAADTHGCCFQTWWKPSWWESWTSWMKRTVSLSPATNTLCSLFTASIKSTSDWRSGLFSCALPPSLLLSLRFILSLSPPAAVVSLVFCYCPSLCSKFLFCATGCTLILQSFFSSGYYYYCLPLCLFLCEHEILLELQLWHQFKLKIRGFWLRPPSSAEKSYDSHKDLCSGCQTFSHQWNTSYTNQTMKPYMTTPPSNKNDFITEYV